MSACDATREQEEARQPCTGCTFPPLSHSRSFHGWPRAISACLGKCGLNRKGPKNARKSACHVRTPEQCVETNFVGSKEGKTPGFGLSQCIYAYHFFLVHLLLLVSCGSCSVVMCWCPGAIVVLNFHQCTMSGSESGECKTAQRKAIQNPKTTRKTSLLTKLLWLTPGSP